MRVPDRRRDDTGSATVEFVLVGLLLMVPLTYVVLGALTVQSHAYAVVTAARSAARAYVTAPSSAVGSSDARRRGGPGAAGPGRARVRG